MGLRFFIPLLGLLCFGNLLQAQDKKSDSQPWVAPLQLEQLGVSAADQRWFSAQKKKVREALVPELSFEESLSVQPDILTTRERKKKEGQENE
ncbi:MAG: hypothetical protein N2Z70_00830 [Bdellovibrionaceae bacterium]|nr:hypothetical protein [Pseudobdellovibrionaceae bacterium]